MSEITKIAAVAMTMAIWEYDPELSDNHVINGAIDVVTVMRTLSVKVSTSVTDIHVLLSHCPQINASSQQIEYFEKLQANQGLTTSPLKMKLHSNICWGTAHGMLDRAAKLEDVSLD